MQPRNPGVLWGPLTAAFKRQGPLFHTTAPLVNEFDDLEAELAFSFDDNIHAHPHSFLKSL